ncbi:hypothetical protein [Streptomyces sp. MBT62]|uniref:hypothetical protein n=1 Tax=Streptomyces sp. MBT62 TaxID=2800410 RepID=UPI00190C73A8|nr:hypothetical protein [Streptomyces sp. MBT62]MBK3567067.1 hypothetical protein [Streptomyces sp. MBT62]
MPGTTPGKISVTCAALALSLLGTAAVSAAAAAEPQPPQHVVGELIRGGADGSPHEVFCPAMQHVYGGGYEITAAPGARLGPKPADLLVSRSNDNASGWIVAVHKGQISPHGPQEPQEPQKPQDQHDQQHDGRTGGSMKNHAKPGKHDAEPADLTIHLVCSDETMSHGA